ncbi:unnamed protein product [Urochloa humidicola]
MAALHFALPTVATHFKDLVLSNELELPALASCCLVSDVDPVLRAAEEIGMPRVTFWTTSASSFMAMQQCRHLVAKGLVPLKDAQQLRNGYMDSTVVDDVPGLPKGMRLRDFPTFIRTTNPDDAVLAVILSSMEGHRTVPSAVISHTFDELESHAIAAMSDILPPIYAVGPLPLILTHAAVDDPAVGSTSLSKQDRACLDWLDGKRPNSVVFASFGSLVKLTGEQLAELAWGLAGSGHDFLWAIRSDQPAEPALPPEFMAAGRGFVTSWCPQEAVLRHAAVGAFLTHCGWNSMMEGLLAGVPMLCWPFAADQQTNRRMACVEWGVGVEVGEDPTREEVAAAIREVMGGGGRGEDMRRAAAEWKEKAAIAARPRGSSWVNLEKVVNEVLAPVISKI